MGLDSQFLIGAGLLVLGDCEAIPGFGICRTLVLVSRSDGFGSLYA